MLIVVHHCLLIVLHCCLLVVEHCYLLTEGHCCLLLRHVLRLGHHDELVAVQSSFPNVLSGAIYGPQANTGREMQPAKTREAACA